jgi:hypothetical protein
MHVHDIRPLLCEDLIEGHGDLAGSRLLPMIEVKVSTCERVNANAALFRSHRVRHAALSTSESPGHDDDLTPSPHQRRRVCRDDQLSATQELRREPVHDQQDLH